ncbi:Uncharacterised protein [Mycobacteroides abscessus subsp. abscessus]|nr:Uncharacterised protein [Mycobacteroides abscessus subsp. abscessus]
MGAECGLHHLRDHGEPAGADGLVQASQHPQPALIELTEIVSVEPAVFGEGLVLGYVSIPGGHGGTAKADPSLRADAHLDPVEGNPVVNAPSAGLAHSVGADHRHAGLRGPDGDGGGQRSSAQEDGVKRGQRFRCLRIAQSFYQLCCHQGDVSPAPGHLGDCSHKVGHGEAGRDIEHHGVASGLDAAQQYLHSGDVMGRQRQQPLARTTQACRCGRAAGGQGLAGEHGALGFSGSAGGRDHHRDIVCDGFVGGELGGQEMRVIGVVGRNRQDRVAAAIEQLSQAG